MSVQITDIQGVTTTYHPIDFIQYNHWDTANYNERVVYLEGANFKALIPWSVVVRIQVFDN